jgi:hypothetical protein
VTFISQHARDYIERVRIRRVLAERHQEDRILLSHSMVHPLLKRGLLRRDHVVLANDVVDSDLLGRNLLSHC